MHGIVWGSVFYPLQLIYIMAIVNLYMHIFNTCDTQRFWYFVCVLENYHIMIIHHINITLASIGMGWSFSDFCALSLHVCPSLSFIGVHPLAVILILIPICTERFISQIYIFIHLVVAYYGWFSLKIWNLFWFFFLVHFFKYILSSVSPLSAYSLVFQFTILAFSVYLGF